MSSGAAGHSADKFVGREREVASLSELFLRGERLVTILGPPGIGKTRLALEYLRALGADGAAIDRCFCDLSEARDDGGVRAAVARTLDVAIERSDGDGKDALVAALNARRPLLLVLDNLEQVSSSAASRVTEWLLACPELRLLTTSRERLRVQGEMGFELSPLAVPESDSSEVETDAVALFVERARAQIPDFAVTKENEAAVTGLSRILGGMPLAIELAAARIGVAGLDELAVSLRANLDIVARGYRHAAPRHATLRAAIQWSWDLLDAAERNVLSQCSIFRGGFSLPAAQIVLSGEGCGSQTLETLHSLSDKSMLRGGARAGGAARFELYFGIREFAAEQLEMRGDVVALRGRHAIYYIRAGDAWSTEVDHLGSPGAERALALERDNLLAAYEHTWASGACKTEDLSHALQAIVALESTFVAHGPIAQLTELLNRFFRRPDVAAVEAVLRARGLRARGKALQLSGMLDAAEQDMEQALSLLLGQEDAWMEASILADSGVLHHQRRHVETARARYEQALLLYEKLGSKRQEARLFGNIGALHHDIRDFEMAEAYYLRALGFLRRLDEPRFEGNVLANLGVLTHEQGRHEEAARYFERAEPPLTRAGDRRLLGIARGNWGVLEHERGQLDSARQLLACALRELTEFGDSASAALCLARLGAVKAEMEALDESRRDLEEAERAVDGEEDPLTLAAIQLYDAFRRLRSEVPVTSDAIRRGRLRINRARQPFRDDGATAEDLSDDVRSALRLLEREVRRFEPLASLLHGIPEEALVVGLDAIWFRPPHGLSRSLSRNGAVRRILSALVRAHEHAAPGGLDLEALRAAGWPGEKMTPEAAANRVHVALTELRKKGLKACIQRSESGYALDPTLVVRVVEQGPPPGAEP